MGSPFYLSDRYVARACQPKSGEKARFLFCKKAGRDSRNAGCSYTTFESCTVHQPGTRMNAEFFQCSMRDFYCLKIIKIEFAPFVCQSIGRNKKCAVQTHTYIINIIEKGITYRDSLCNIHAFRYGALPFP